MTDRPRLRPEAVRGGAPRARGGTRASARARTYGIKRSEPARLRRRLKREWHGYYWRGTARAEDAPGFGEWVCCATRDPRTRRAVKRAAHETGKAPGRPKAIRPAPTPKPVKAKKAKREE